MKTRFPVAVSVPVVIALIAILDAWLFQVTSPRGERPALMEVADSSRGDAAVRERPSSSTDERAKEEREAVASRSGGLREWLARWKAEESEIDKGAILAEGVTLAEARSEVLHKLMKTDPKSALASALGWDEWLSLPGEVRAVSEQPVSAWVRQESFVSCDPDTGLVEHELRLQTSVGDDWRSYSHGRRQAPLTRAGLPVQGIVLRGEAAVRADAVQVVSGVEAEAVRKLFPAIAVPSGRSAWSGAALDPNGQVDVLVGGHVATVNAAEVSAMSTRLHAWEDRPGEEWGVEMLAAWLESGEQQPFVPLHEALAAPAPANPWTETAKQLLLIRVDFPDLEGAREEQSVLIDKLTNDVSPVIDDMSFGKTRLIVTVTPEVIRLPESSGFYPAEQAAGNNGNGQLHDSAQAGATTLGYNMNDYDFICVQFASIGMGYGGLAGVGGKKSWIQSSGTSVFVHEFGHNYGLGHSSRWIPTTTDPFDPGGTNVEYGGGSSMMGGGSFPSAHFDSQAKAFLNWLEPDQWLDVTASGRYRLFRADHRSVPAASLLGGLRIDRPDGSGDAIWVGYKRNHPDHRRLSRGVQILWEKNGSPRRAWVIRAGRSGSFDEDDFELPTGQTFSTVSGASSVHITPVERGGSEPARWIDVAIQIDPPAGNQAPTAEWLHNPIATVQPYTSVRFELSVADPDGDELAYHWDLGDGSEVSVNGRNLVHTYSYSGLFSVSVEVSDMKGGTTTLMTTVDVNADVGLWTQRGSGTTTDFQDGAANSQRVIAVNTAGEVAHSTDGETWTLLDLKSQQGVDALQLYDVHSEYQTFIAAGRERALPGGAWEGCLYRSTDGANWARVHLGGSLLYAMDRTSLRWVATGENETVRQSFDDGLTWESVAFPTSDHVQGIAYGNGVWLAMADRNSDRTYAFTSPDLVTWTEQTWAASFGNNKIARPAWFLNGQFYFGGFALGLQSLPDVTQAPTQELSGLDVEDLIFHQGQFFLAGRTSDSGDNIGLLMKKVPDGTWSSNLLPEGERHRAVIPFQGRLIVVGWAGGIWQSGPIATPSYDGWWGWQTLNRFDLGTEDDPLDSPTGFGLPNLYHYAVGNPPGGGAAPFLPYAGREGGSGRLKLSVPRDGIRPDVTYRIVRSTNLRDWSGAGVTILQNDAGLLEACGAGPGPEGAEFLRFEAELTP